MFDRLARLAALCAREPSPPRIERALAMGRVASPLVPDARRADWDKLVSQLAKDDARKKERFEALGRACALFAEPPPPLEADASIETIPGFGKVALDALAGYGITTIFDLLWTLPTGYDDRTQPIDVPGAVAEARAAVEAGEIPARVCVRGEVRSASLVAARGRRFVSVVVRDGAGKASITASWFFAAHGILAVAKTGLSCLLVGRIRFDKAGRARMAHPELVRDEDAARVVLPRYPRFGVPEAVFRRSVGVALARCKEPFDPVPRVVADRESMVPAKELLVAVHASAASVVPPEGVRRAALERLAFAEGFTRLIQRVLAETNGAEAPVLRTNRAVQTRLRAELGFELTRGQNEAIATIAKDLAAARPMRRLLLGDVGTGKTAVALAAAAQCVAAGYQVAILAPTGVLAEQYMDAVGPLARATGASVARVTAGGTAPLAPLAKGDIRVAIGTHALLGEGVRFARLGLVIVDEQHRLGVAQRVALVHKGAHPHLLTLSATPIPRSLALALRGELATSTLTERPKGRPPVETEVLPERALPRVLLELREAAARGERAFIVCPRIDEREDDEGDGIPSAEETAQKLAESLAPIRVALLHGGQKSEEQRASMRAFRKGEAQILVATTVVEVGVDIPEATRMVILGAERFGMAQLHQLRGRVGRGDRPGRCFLLHGSVDGLAIRRLAAVRSLVTGEEIARADLALRGAGDLGGTRQSGLAEELLYLDPASPPAWLERLEGDARRLLLTDPRLEAAENRGLALAAQRFRKALAVRDEAG